MPPDPDSRELGEVLGVALRAGQLMLENGGNASRVEEVVERFATALGADRVDVYATPSGIIATALAGTEHRTRILRIARTGIDLNRVACVVALAHRITDVPEGTQAVSAELERIARARPNYGAAVMIVGAAIACACFALLFGGRWQEAVATAAAAAVGQALRQILARVLHGRLFSSVIVAAISSALALLFALGLRAPHPGIAMIAAVLLLVPGVLMVSSVGDLFRGDILSGLSRAASATLVILATGVGLAVTLVLFRAPSVPTPDPWLPRAAEVALAFGATAGFALLFDVPLRALAIAPLVGALGHAVRGLALSMGAAPEPAVFFAGAAIALAADLAARPLGFPSNILSIPAFIPLIPGVAAFRTVLHFVGRSYADGVATLVETLLWVGALAAGVGAVQAFTGRRRLLRTSAFARTRKQP